MNFITKILAQLFEAFKVKNPVLAGIITVAASAAVYTASQGELYGLFILPEWGKTAVEIVGLFIASVTGSQTFKYLPAKQQETARK